MKTVLLFLILAAHCGFAQVKNGGVVPDHRFATLLNAPTKTATLNQLRGKIVVIEFWATWCGPCITAMPHLDALQKKYADRLQVITVTDEAPERISHYLTARPSALWFAIDSAHTVNGSFPHQSIPHTVLIDPDGKLIAQTTPASVTNEVIDSLWRRQTVHLPEKRDNPMTLGEIMDTYFKVADTVQRRFVMQTKIEGSSSVRMTHLNDPIFKDRRITCLNLTLTSLYRIAYGDFPYNRTIDKTGSNDNSPMYSLDLIVATPNELSPALQQELASRFDMRASIQPQSVEVSVLRIVDRAKFDLIPKNKSGRQTYSAHQGELDQQAATMADFAEYLESFATARRIVVDETGNRELLDINFTYQPEVPGSLPAALAEMGLALEKQRRTVDMLVLKNP